MPPIQIGSRAPWGGLGSMAMASASWCSPRRLDALVAPARPQQLDRLVHAGAPVAEVLAERLVLGLLPADADAEAHPAARQRVERATCLATSTGWRWGSTSTSVDRLTRSVTAAAKPSVISASRIGICGGYIGAGRVSVG